MPETYKMKIAGLERELPRCPLNEKLDIAAFVMFSDVEVTVAAAAELFLERNHGGKEDFIQIQICRRQHSRRISPDHVVCPKLVRIEVVNHLFSGIDAVVNANAIGGHVLVVKGSARPGRVAIIGLSAP